MRPLIKYGAGSVVTALVLFMVGAFCAGSFDISNDWNFAGRLVLSTMWLFANFMLVVQYESKYQ